MDVKAARTCVDCGKEYKRLVVSPDDRQDLREGVSAGTCDYCWSEHLILMMEPH